MLKALLQKQKLEIRRLYFYSQKKGTVITGKSGSAGLTILFIFLYLVLLGSFFALSFLMGEPLVKANQTWIFFMIMSIFAFIVGIFGSVFSTSSALFRAKDNEFLLAMPIPPSKILIARMVSVYIMGIIYESVVLLPAILFYFIMGKPSVLSIIFCILGFFILGFLILAFSCFFGWLVSLIASKLKNKSALTVILSLPVIAAVFYLQFRSNVMFQELALHAREIGEAMKGWGYPIYALGLGMSGDVTAFLVFTAITAVLFSLTWLIMSKSFKKIVSTKNEAVKATFSESQIRVRSLNAALRKRELKRFTSSPTYMLNCGLGALILVLGAAFLLIKMTDLRIILSSVASKIPLLPRFLPVAGAFAICLFSPLCDIAALPFLWKERMSGSCRRCR